MLTPPSVPIEIGKKEPNMLTLHHVNLVSDDVTRLEAFYRDVLGLENLPGMVGLRDTTSYDRKVVFIDGSPTQLHLATRDDELGFRNHQVVNPVTANGHIAFRTDDIDQFKTQLRKHNVPFSDYGIWAMRGWHQIFFYDPSGRVVEVHQVKE
jgi:glyoxylase I family protein